MATSTRAPKRKTLANKSVASKKDSPNNVVTVNGRRRRPWALQSRENILAAATEEIAKVGFERARLTEIARRAGMTPGSVHTWFKNKEDLFPDADGEEEDPSAELSVTYSKTLARYIVKVDSNLAEESLVIRGVKKGSRSLKFTLTTDEDGVAGVKTKTKLAGFTLTLYFGSTKLDSVKVS